MQIDGKHYQSIWYEPESDSVRIIDQTQLPHEFKILVMDSIEAACVAISSMQVRGAPLIGVTAAYGLYLGLRDNAGELDALVSQLAATRPTAVNLVWALERCRQFIEEGSVETRISSSLEIAQILEKEDIAVCEAIGEEGADLLQKLWQEKKQSQSRLNILTHCNAGALATVDWGTALAVIYKTVEREIPVHVWVDETRPRNQGASLTCWELSKQGIDHTLIVDNAGGHLMQHGEVDAVIVGADRVTARGDVCNKIGTYLKALAARDNDIPFYVAIPVSTFDSNSEDGLSEIPIEQRAESEVLEVHGSHESGRNIGVAIAPPDTRASNYGFDVTPAKLVSAIITERGSFAANTQSLCSLIEKH